MSEGNCLSIGNGNENDFNSRRAGSLSQSENKVNQTRSERTENVNNNRDGNICNNCPISVCVHCHNDITQSNTTKHDNSKEHHNQQTEIKPEQETEQVNQLDQNKKKPFYKKARSFALRCVRCVRAFYGAIRSVELFDELTMCMTTLYEE